MKGKKKKRIKRVLYGYIMPCEYVREFNQNGWFLLPTSFKKYRNYRCECDFIEHEPIRVKMTLEIMEVINEG